MSKYMQPVRGTQDLLPETARKFRLIDEVGIKTASRFGFKEIITPIFEFSAVFHRTLGETSDAVTKETYTFADRGGDSLTLRPEGTAGVARAFISNGMAQNLPLKFYYSGPMFRYERPQKGRYRQFQQVGVEYLGPDTPEADVETIALGALYLKELGLSHLVQLELNSLGDTESRNRHKEALVQYLTPFKNELSSESQIRLEKNPLRILDSKDPNDQKLLTSAPALEQYFNDSSKAFFDKVKSGLNLLGINFLETKNLVRGFDYYTHSVFEFTTTHLGSQSAVLSGGRYNGLIELMGGPSTPGVGWAAGVDRLALLYTETLKKERIFAVTAADESSEEYCFKLAHELRSLGVAVEFIAGSGQLGKKMKKSAKLECEVTIIVGETERLSGQFSVKVMSSGEQKTLTKSEIIKLFTADEF